MVEKCKTNFSDVVVQASASTKAVDDGLNELLCVVQTADLNTAYAIQKACAERIEDLQRDNNNVIVDVYTDHMNTLQLDSENKYHKIPEQPLQQVVSDGEHLSAQMPHWPLFEASQESSSKEDHLSPLSDEEIEHRAEGATVDKESPISNEFPTHMPHTKLYDSGNFSYKFHPSNPYHPLRSHAVNPLRSHAVNNENLPSQVNCTPEQRAETERHYAQKLAELYPETFGKRQQHGESSKAHSSKVAEEPLKRSESIVADASNKLREGIANIKDKVRGKAATATPFSAPNNFGAVPGAFDQDDATLFSHPNESTKRLEVIREESPLGTKIWAVKGKKKSNANVQEDQLNAIEETANSIHGYETAITGKETEDSIYGDETATTVKTSDTSFVGTENALQPTNISSPKKFLPRQTLANDLPTTPLPKSSLAVPRSVYPPRSSSLTSKVSEIESVEDERRVVTFDTTIDVEYTYSDFEGSEGEESDEARDKKDVEEQDFEPIGNSQLIRGFQRVQSENDDGPAISRSASQKTLPRLPSQDEAVLPQQVSGLPIRTPSRARAMTATLFRKATGSIRRTAKRGGGSSKASSES